MSFNEKGVRDLLRARCDDYGSQYQFATKYKLSPQYVCDVIKGRRKPGPSMLKALGLRSRTYYETTAKSNIKWGA